MHGSSSATLLSGHMHPGCRMPPVSKCGKKKDHDRNATVDQDHPFCFEHQLDM
jgi:hypothetical protein